MARVVSLFVSPGIGQPMQPRTFVRALAGRGLHGDRYALGQGSYSNLPRPAARHISLIAREAIEASNEELVRRERYHLRRVFTNIVGLTCGPTGIDMEVAAGRPTELL